MMQTELRKRRCAFLRYAASAVQERFSKLGDTGDAHEYNAEVNALERYFIPIRLSEHCSD